MLRNRLAPLSKEILLLAGVFTVSVLLRLGMSIWMGDQVVDLPGVADQLSYHTLAKQVLAGQGLTFPEDWWPATQAGAQTAHWSYLYTFFLVVVYSIFGVHPLAARLIQAILVGLLHPWIAYTLGTRVFNQKVGIIAAGLTAIYAYFIYYSAALMTEAFYITAILIALLLAIRLAENVPNSGSPKRKNYLFAIALGFSLGIAVLLRQLILLIIPVLFLWILSVGGRRKIIPLAITALLIAGTILPFTFYNYSRFNRFVLLNTNAGFAFFWGNHPAYGTQFIPILPSEIYFQMIPRELLRLDEAALDQALLKLGLQFILDDPQRYFLLSLSRIPAYFMFWPSSESGIASNISRLASFGLLFPFMLFGLARVVTRREDHSRLTPAAMLLILFAACYTGIHLLSWALIRYRLPVDSVMILFAAIAFMDIYAYFNHRSLRSKPDTLSTV